MQCAIHTDVKLVDVKGHGSAGHVCHVDISSDWILHHEIEKILIITFVCVCVCTWKMEMQWYIPPLGHPAWVKSVHRRVVRHSHTHTHIPFTLTCPADHVLLLGILQLVRGRQYKTNSYTDWHHDGLNMSFTRESFVIQGRTRHQWKNTMYYEKLVI